MKRGEENDGGCGYATAMIEEIIIIYDGDDD
jgi:hypothetical protein